MNEMLQVRYGLQSTQSQSRRSPYGPANGDWASRHILCAACPPVVGYDLSSESAADFKTKPWYEVLAEPGARSELLIQNSPQGFTVELLQLDSRLLQVRAIDHGASRDHGIAATPCGY